MWEAEPRLYWRVKINGKWTWRAAELMVPMMVDPGLPYMVAKLCPIRPEVIESE